MTTKELKQTTHLKLLAALDWLFRPPGLCHSLWYAFWYKEWPEE